MCLIFLCEREEQVRQAENKDHYSRQVDISRVCLLSIKTLQRG